MSLHKFMPNMSISAVHSLCQIPALCALLFGSAVMLTACGGGHEEVKAVDKVEEAAALAKSKAPEPEKFEFETTDTTIVETTDANMTVDEITGETAVDDTIDAGALTDGESITEAVVSDEADADAAASDTATTTTDNAATDNAEVADNTATDESTASE